jgi:serine/threonine protein phosphatase PrpC
VPLKIESVGKTDVGLVRSGNEDYLHIDEANNVFAVCDGMGGHQAGEVASKTASETIETLFADFRQNLIEEAELSLNRTLPPSGEVLVKSIRLANRAVYQIGLADQSKKGMGTTIVAVAFEADIMSIAHVGDSRVYRVGQSQLEPLTVDHSWVAEIQQKQNVSAEEANSFFGKNVITRALGVRENVEVDYRVIKVRSGDRFVLCSDGLCGFAEDDEIYDVIEASDNDKNQIADNLIQMANDRGGSDNVTVIVIDIADVDKSPIPEVEVITFEGETEATMSAEDSWLERIAEARASAAEKKSKKPESTGKRGAVWTVLIFALFAVIATLIIFYSQIR